MERGDVWLVSLPFAGGREEAGTRPVVVIQDALYGRTSPLVLVVILTSQLGSSRFPGTVTIAPDISNGLLSVSVAMVFQARALDRRRFVRPLGNVSSDDLGAILSELNRLTGQASDTNGDERA